jgi:hypothetical protein
VPRSSTPGRIVNTVWMVCEKFFLQLFSQSHRHQSTGTIIIVLGRWTSMLLASTTERKHSRSRYTKVIDRLAIIRKGSKFTGNYFPFMYIIFFIRTISHHILMPRLPNRAPQSCQDCPIGHRGCLAAGLLQGLPILNLFSSI